MTGKQDRILIVDDEPSLLHLMEKYLSRLGYSVVACQSSEQAWGLFEPEPSAYPLVLADVTLPGMSGTELVAKMFAVCPSVQVVLTSGYAVDLSGFSASMKERIRVLKKPFLPAMLLQSLEGLAKGSGK